MIGRGLAAVFLLVIPQEVEILRDAEATKAEFAEFERAQIEGRRFPAADPDVVHACTVRLPGGQELGVRVLLPEGYDGTRPLPLLVAMGGGPAPSADVAKDQARQMAANWWGLLKKKGWILAVLEDSVSLVRPARDLRYDVLRPEDFRAAVDEVQERFNVHPNRICATGVSLGANYAIHFAAHRPDWFAAVVPASSEGESRESLLRNLGGVSVYALNGARDRTIRTIDGPRKMAEILKKLGNRIEYEESQTGGHESFRERYGDVLVWLEKAIRDPWPKVVVRVPHEGLFPTSRRRYWVDVDSDQALVRAEAAGQSITVSAACCRWLRLSLHDALVDLDRPLRVVVNGKEAFSGKLVRTKTATRDRGVVVAGTIKVPVPLDDSARDLARRWTSTLAPSVPESKTAWWEFYARATLAERAHRPVWEAEPEGDGYRLTSVEADSPEGKAGLKVGDVIVGFEDEFFYKGGEGLSLVARTLLRRPRPAEHYSLQVLRDGKAVLLLVALR
jgi:predicted esterase